MAEFDDNPFGEPNINDPFSDPAIRRAVNSTPANRGLEDYNPFAEQSTQGTAQVRGAANPPIYGGVGATQQPATLQPSSYAASPPEYARTPQQTVNTSGPAGATMSPTSSVNQNAVPEWQKARAEEEIRNISYYPKRNNWPPLPDKCCFQPCFYQDIETEIQTDFQKIVKQLYRLWIFHGCILLLNIVGGFVLMLCSEGFTTFGLSILYFLLFTPFSFLCWFRPAYRAFKSDSSFNFMVYFFVFFFQFIVTAIQAIGIPGFGTCGLIMAIYMFDATAKGVFVGLLLLIIAIGFILAAVGDLLLLTKVHRIYRSSNASVSKAQQEFATTFLRNEHVQQVAGDVTANVVRAKMTDAANQPRY